jgi:hypothetical protein
MSGNKNLKEKYEAPVVVPLGELATGIGAQCIGGSSASGVCTSLGEGASASCGTGTLASAACNTGGTASRACADGNMAFNPCNTGINANS